MTQTSVGVFINDDWKATPRLTLSAGLRYEVFTPISERDNLATNFFPDRGLVQLGTNGLDQLYKADKNNFGPRAGLAWDRDGRRQNQRARRVRADLRRRRRWAPLHPGLFSTPTLGVFRVSFSQTPRFAPDSRGARVSIRTTRAPAATTSACSRACRSSARRRPARRRSTSSRCRRTSSSAGTTTSTSRSSARCCATTR